MQVKICSNCKLPKPSKMFVFKRNGFWVSAERCRACRKQARPFFRFWRKVTPEKRESNAMVRRAKEYKCPVIIPFTKSEIIKRDGLNCYICGKELTEKQATIDHVLPLSRGGFHCPSNAKIACLKCNQEKSSKIYE